MNVFEYDSYTKAVLAAIEEKKKDEPGWTMAQLASSCLMQPSYLTNVLKGRGDFNSDQLYRVCEQLGLSIEDFDYLCLLLEHQRTSYSKRKNLLSQKIKEVRQQYLRAEKNLTVKTVELSPEQLERYYLDPYIQLIHIYLGSHSDVATVDLMIQKFALPRAQLLNILKVLEEIKYIRRKGAKFEVLVEGRHLPRESHILRPHQLLMRLKSMDQIQRLPPDQTYGFSATISTTPEVRTKLQAEFLKFIKAAEKLVRSHPPQKMYQLNFDLFPWEND